MSFDIEGIYCFFTILRKRDAPCQSPDRFGSDTINRNGLTGGGSDNP